MKFVVKGPEKDYETGRNLYWKLDFGWVLKPEATRFEQWEAKVWDLCLLEGTWVRA